MNIFYRGHVIHEDIRAICYTVYGQRPRRAEIAACGTASEAMRWVDREVSGNKLRLNRDSGELWEKGLQ